MNDSEHPNRGYRFGQFEVDVRTGELSRKGHRVHVQEQPFQILCALLERPGEVVTREELRGRLWPSGTHVDFDNSMNAAVNRLREALGDTAENPRFVETLPRRGYRFLAPVTEFGNQKLETRNQTEEEENKGRWQDPSTSLPSSATGGRRASRAGRAGAEDAILPAHTPARRWMWVGAAAVLFAGITAGGWWMWARPRVQMPPGKLMLAVLPFENLTGSKDNDYFISGLNDEMISQLGRLRPMRLGVIARNSVLPYKDHPKPANEIGQELGVQYLLTGGVRNMGSRVRITVRLIDAMRQITLWADTYERDSQDAFALQTDVARHVAGSLAIELLPSDQEAMERAATSSGEAYNFYLRGRYFWNMRTQEGFWRAVDFYRKALEKDPNYSLAHTGLAETFDLLGGYGFVAPKQAFPQARAAALSALGIDEGQTRAHAAYGFYLFYHEWNWAQAESEFRRAIQLNPNNATAHQWYGELLHAVGRLEEALGELRRAAELDPLSRVIPNDAGWVLLSQREYAVAIEQFRKSERMDPNWAAAHVSLAFAYARNGAHAQALEELKRAEALAGNRVAVLETLGYALGIAGKTAEARAVLQEMREAARTTRISPYSFALVCAGLGEKARAVEWLHAGLEEKDQWLVWLKAHPEWDALRSEARFQGVVRRVGLP